MKWVSNLLSGKRWDLSRQNAARQRFEEYPEAKRLQDILRMIVVWLAWEHRFVDPEMAGNRWRRHWNHLDDDYS